MRCITNYHMMIIFRIIQNASESFCGKDDVYKNLTSVTLSGRLEKLYDGILLSVENMIILSFLILLLWYSGVTCVLSPDISTIILKRLNHRKSLRLLVFLSSRVKT